MSNYGIELYIEGENAEYLNKVIKYLTSPNSTIKDIQSYLRIVDKNMLLNEHYITTYYMEYLNKIEPLSRVDLKLMEKFTEIDKEKIIKLNNIELDNIVDVQEEYKSQMLVEIMKEFTRQIDEMEEVTEEEFQHSLSLVLELVKELKSNNILFVGSRILSREYRIGRRVLQGREDFINFLESEVRHLRNIDKDQMDITYQLDRDSLLLNMYTNENLITHPIPTIQDSWGSLKRGTTLGILAGTSVGKTTMVINYIAKALEEGVNCALFVSEMSISKYISRIISIIGANKYKVFLASDTVETYLDIQHREYLSRPLTKTEEKFLEMNSTQINNIEYILNQLFADSQEDLGRLHVVPELVLEDIPEIYRKLEEMNTHLLIVDHINGLSSNNPRKSVYELTNEGYVSLHGESKKHGVATIISNHIPDDQLKRVNDLDADLSDVRGSNAGQSTKSLDDVLILSATDEQKRAGEIVVRTNKNRDSGVFFEAILLTHRKEIGLLYESN